MNVAIVLFLTGVVLSSTLSEAFPSVFYSDGDGVPVVDEPRVRSHAKSKTSVDYQGGFQNKFDAFNAIDIDGDGDITLAEWRINGGTFEDFADLLLDADENYDEKISAEEFFKTDIEHIYYDNYRFY